MNLIFCLDMNYFASHHRHLTAGNHLDQIRSDEVNFHMHFPCFKHFTRIHKLIRNRVPTAGKVSRLHLRLFVVG